MVTPRQPRGRAVHCFVASIISVALVLLIFTIITVFGAISGHYDISFLGAYLLLALVNYHAGGNDVFYPGFLYTVVWFATMTLLAVSPVDVDAIARRQHQAAMGPAAEPAPPQLVQIGGIASAPSSPPKTIEILEERPPQEVQA